MFNSLKIPAVFLAAGMCWVAFGNSVIAVLTPHAAPLQEDQYRSINNFVFVVITTVVLYVLIRRQLRTLRKSEEEYRQLFESNPNPMWIYQNDTLRFVKVNAAAVKKYEYSKKRFLRMTVYDILPAEEKDRLEQYIKEHQEGIRLAGIWNHVKAIGERFAVSVISHPVVFNTVDCNLVMATDISELLEKETKLQRAYEKIKEFNDTLLQIAWSHSHKVRKPLCSIIGLLDLLKQSSQEEERKELVAMLEVCTTELDRVLRNTNEKVTTLEMLRAT
jgi:PAS domain S-box-containing protein